MPPLANSSASRVGWAMVGIAGMVRVRHIRLPPLDKLHELSWDYCTQSLMFLDAPAPYDDTIGNLRPEHANYLFNLPIWGFGPEPVALRSTLPADIVHGSDRVLDLWSRRLKGAGALSSDEAADPVATVAGPAATTRSHVLNRFEDPQGVPFNQRLRTDLSVFGLDRMRFAGARSARDWAVNRDLNRDLRASLQSFLHALRPEHQPATRYDTHDWSPPTFLVDVSVARPEMSRVQAGGNAGWPRLASQARVRRAPVARSDCEVGCGQPV